MAELIPEIKWTEFKKLKEPELRQLKSCEVTFNGEYLFTFVNPQTDYIKVQTEYMSQLSNAVGGKDLSDVVGVVNAPL